MTLALPVGLPRGVCSFQKLEGLEFIFLKSSFF